MRVGWKTLLALWGVTLPGNSGSNSWGLRGLFRPRATSHHLNQFQNQQRDRTQREEPKAIYERQVGRFQQAAQKCALLTPYLEGDRNDHHDDEVNV